MLEDDESRIYLPPSSVDDEQRDPDDTLPGYLESTANTTFSPLWLREASKTFHWKWVPLPLRKAGWAIVDWVKGPVPPETLLLKPLFPHLQELPVRYLERFFPGRKYKIGLLSLLYFCWFLPWFVILLHSRSSGYIKGYGQPQTLSCSSTYWSFGNNCGLNGNDCRPFSRATLAFRCPAECDSTLLLEPHMVGNETYNYQNLVIGGPQPGSGKPIYRADSFICQAAIHAGVISNTMGGCGVAKLEGAAHSYPAVEQHGIQSIGFPSTFPKSFSFVDLSSSQATCPADPRWPLLGVTIGAIVLLWLFCTSPPILFFSTFFILISHVGLVSDPPSDMYFADLFSTFVSRLLPASFIAYVLYRFCALPLLGPLSSPMYQFSKLLLYLPLLFIGALNNYTFAKWIPLQRLTPHDIQAQPGAKVALAMVIPAVISIILGQTWHIRCGGLMPRYLKVYCSMGFLLLILLSLPGLRLRIHHYILAILLMPGTAFPIRPSLIYQGLLLGLFVNGVARWGFASIIETPAALGETPGGKSGWWGANYPNISDSSVFISLPNRGSKEEYRGNGNITFALWEHERMADLGVDGVTVLVNDVERWRGYLDEDKRGEFTWHRHGHKGLELLHGPKADFDIDIDIDGVNENENLLRVMRTDGSKDEDDNDEPEHLYFRFAFLKGAESGNYGGAGVWLKDGTWISPPSCSSSSSSSSSTG